MPLKTLRLGVVPLVVAASLVTAFVLNAQQPTKDQDQQPLRPTVTILSQGYCANAEDNHTEPGTRFGDIAFRLHLRVENTSKREVILCRKCIVINPEPSLSPQSPGNFGYGGMMWDSFPPVERRQDPARPDDNYVILKPHEAFDADYQAAIMVSYDSMATPQMNLHSGSYLLHVGFGTWWVESSDTSGELRVKWKDYGVLFSGGLSPAPVPLQIEIPKTLSTCPVNK
jgi:hypothetical protein